MPDANHCPECGAPLPANLPQGLCSRCALSGALEISESETPIRPSQSRGAAAPGIGDPGIGHFGDYELLEEIARGGMGIVYKARQVSLDRIVAVKLLLLGQYASEEFIHRFRIEASAAASLQHPNIVAIHEVGVHQGQHYFAMDFVDGPNLAQLVRDQPLPAKRAAGYVKTIAEAIHFAHTRRILHRDLKPSNVLIDSNDQPRLTDFGLAKNLANDSELTLTGQVLGSPSFMPPEQALGERGKLAPASDVYSLGAILYHALTGRPPFVGETLNATLQQVQGKEPVALRLLTPSVPADLETVCLKCLEKEPGERFQSALELAEELDRFLRGEPIQSRPVSAPEKLWRWCRRKPALSSLGGTVIVLLLAVTIGSPVALFRINRERLRAEQNLYVANVRLANEALGANNLVHARALLDGIADSPQQRRFRGWEWQHLMERCQNENSIVLGKHDTYVAAVALAPDGRTAASLSGDGIVQVWNLAARKRELFWTAHENPEKGKPTFSNLALVFSPDGGTIATGGRDNTVRIWEASSGRIIAELEDLSNTCRGLAFSGDGRMLGSIDIVGQACLWDLSQRSPALLHRWPASGVLARDIAFSPESMRVAVSGYEQPATVWDISNPQEPPVLDRTLDGTHWTAAFSPDGKWLLAAGSSGHDLRRWELPGWTEQPRWPARSANLNALAFSADSRFVASGYANGEITLWDMSGWQPPTSLLGHEDHVTSLAFSRDGLTLVSSSRDRTVRLWDLPRKDRFEAAGRGFATLAACFSADSRYLASVEFVRPGLPGAARTEHSVTLWEVTAAGLRERATKPVGGGAFSVYPSFSPDGTVLAVDDWRNGIQLLAVPSLAPIDQLTSPAFAPMFRRDALSIVYAQGTRLMWRDLSASNATSVMVGELARPLSRLTVTPDGRTAACCTEEDGDRGIQFWDVIHKRRLGTAAGHEASIYGLAFSPDGRWLASTSADTKVGIWNVTERTLHKFLPGHSGVILSVAFSADGRRLAAAGEDGVVRLWDAETWQEVAAFHAHASLNSVAFSPDNHWLAAAAQDGTIRLWHAPTIEQIKTETKLTKGQ